MYTDILLEFLLVSANFRHLESKSLDLLDWAVKSKDLDSMTVLKNAPPL